MTFCIKKSYINTVINVAINSNRTNYFHGAILFSGGKIYAEGTNTSERSVFNGIVTPCIHAEMNCIIRGIRHTDKKRKKYNILVVRVDNNNNLIDSMPCKICVNMMKKYNIKKIYYSTNNGCIEKINLNELVSEHITHGVRFFVGNMSFKNQMMLLGSIEQQFVASKKKQLQKLKYKNV